LIARSPRRWWLYCGLALIPVAFLALVALPVWAKPLTTNYKPLEDRPFETRIKALAVRCGVANIPVFVGGDSTRMDGLGPTNRIVLQTSLASVESRDQIEFTIGHELKHYVMGDNWKALTIIAAFLLAGFWLTDRLGRAAIRRFSWLWGFSELSDPASLPLVVFILTFLWLAILSFFNMFARHIELEADRFGLELTHQNHAAAMIFVRDAQTSLAPDWGTFFVIFQADHPSIRTRIEFANSYKPWEQGAPLATSDFWPADQYCTAPTRQKGDSHCVGAFRIEPQANSKFKKSNPDLLQIEEPGWRAKCGTDGSSRVYSSRRHC
jgi:Zn-dependent protease with chaperone function